MNPERLSQWRKHLLLAFALLLGIAAAIVQALTGMDPASKAWLVATMTRLAIVLGACWLCYPQASRAVRIPHCFVLVWGLLIVAIAFAIRPKLIAAFFPWILIGLLAMMILAWLGRLSRPGSRTDRVRRP